MHAFDLAKLAGAESRVRRAKPGEIITTLDGVERKLDDDMLVIADRDRAQAVAGVMGGAASEVSASTTSDRLRERVLQAGLRPAHEQAARPEDRSLGALRARRRRQRRGRGHAARDRADGAIGAGKVSGPIVDRYPRPRPATQLHLRRERLALAARRRGARRRRRADPARARPRRHAGRRRLGRASRRPSASICCAKSTSSKKSAATTDSTSSTRRSRC